MMCPLVKTRSFSNGKFINVNKGDASLLFGVLFVEIIVMLAPNQLLLVLGFALRMALYLSCLFVAERQGAMYPNEGLVPASLGEARFYMNHDDMQQPTSPNPIHTEKQKFTPRNILVHRHMLQATRLQQLVAGDKKQPAHSRVGSRGK